MPGVSDSSRHLHVGRFTATDTRPERGGTRCVCVHTHHPADKNGRRTPDMRAPVLAFRCWCAWGACTPTSGLCAHAHVWTGRFGQGPQRVFFPARSTPPLSPVRACRLRASAREARCGMVHIPMGVTPCTVKYIHTCSQHAWATWRLCMYGSTYVPPERVRPPNRATRTITTSRLNENNKCMDLHVYVCMCACAHSVRLFVHVWAG